MPDNDGQNVSRDAWMAARRGETFRLLAGDLRLDSNDNLNEALTHFTEAIDKAPNFLWAYAHRGLTYRQLGELDNAIKDFEEVIKKQAENNPWIYAQLGETYRLEMDGESDTEKQILGNKAIENFQKAIKQSAGEYAWAHAHLGATHCMLGNAFSRQEDWELAKTSLTKAIDQTQQRYAWAFAYRAVVYFKTKEFKNALEDLQQAYVLDPRVVPNINYQQGLLYNLSGQPQEALKKLNQALYEEPNNPFLFYGIARCKTKKTGEYQPKIEANIAREALAYYALSAIEMLIALAIRERPDGEMKAYLNKQYKEAKKLLNEIIANKLPSETSSEKPQTGKRFLYFTAHNDYFARSGLPSKNEFFSLASKDLSWLGLDDDELDVFKD